MMATVDWLAKVLYEAAESATEAVGIRPLGEPPRPWEALTERQQEAVRRSLTVALEALDDPCLLKLREGEPIVVLRAQDKTAPVAFGLWRGLAHQAGMPIGGPKSIASAEKIDAMLAWQDANPMLVKVPD